MQWWVAFLFVGVSLSLWLAVGGLRFVTERLPRKVTVFPKIVATVLGKTVAATLGKTASGADGTDQHRLTPADVAVLIPAHNEEAGLAATIASALRLVARENIHVIADGCEDSTAAIAEGHGVNVLELVPSQGKAGGIEAGIAHFAITERFELLLVIDADTQLSEHYLDRGLQLMQDPEMVALAGYARTEWQPATLSRVGRVLLSYRARLYAVMQWIKYGQTWRHTNVTPIVPGFASMYRTRVLSQMDLNPPGLVIEDFNMTFELHRRRLGKIAFRPSVFGVSQDPDNLPDYYKQVCRWWLGLWQTIRRHGLWFSWFSAALVLFLVEVLLASLILLLAIAGVALLAMDPISGGLASQWEWYVAARGWLAPVLTPMNLLLFVFLPDYLLTCVAAAWLRRPSLLIYGLGFLPVRAIDAIATVQTLMRMWRAESTGRWDSPARRAVEAPDSAVVAPSRATDAGTATLSASTTGWTRVAAPRINRRDAVLVLADACRASVLAAMLTMLVLVAVPITVMIVGTFAGLIGGALWSDLSGKRGDSEACGVRDE